MIKKSDWFIMFLNLDFVFLKFIKLNTVYTKTRLFQLNNLLCIQQPDLTSHQFHSEQVRSPLHLLSAEHLLGPNVFFDSSMDQSPQGEGVGSESPLLTCTCWKYAFMPETPSPSSIASLMKPLWPHSAPQEFCTIQ